MDKDVVKKVAVLMQSTEKFLKVDFNNLKTQ